MFSLQDHGYWSHAVDLRADEVQHINILLARMLDDTPVFLQRVS